MPPRRRPPTSTGPSGSGAIRLDGLLPGFLQYLTAECGMAKNTLLAYQRDLVRFCAWFREHGPGAFEQIEVSHFTEFLQSLYTLGLAASSVARNLVSVRMFFRYLVMESVIRESIADLVNSPKLWERLPKVLSPEMVDRLLAAPNNDDRGYLRDRALLAILYATGCRVSEVCRIQLRDVHLEERYCRCLGKGNKERIVRLNPVAVAAVEAYLTHERPHFIGDSADSPLLLSRGGRPISRITAWKIVKKYAARVGVSRDVSPHTLRHSFATHLLGGGAEIRALQELLGHASIRTTQIYTHVDHSRIKAVHEKCHPRG